MNRSATKQPTRPARSRAATTLGLAVLALAGCRPAARPPRTEPAALPAARRPNVVFILTDDLDVAPTAHMPTLLARVAGQGTSFRNALVTTPVCAPSRATILTGQYAHNHGLLDNRPPNGYRTFLEAGKENATVATLLSAAGYQTALIGKYVNRYPSRDKNYVPPGWGFWSAVFFPESYYRYRLNVNGEAEEHGDDGADYLTDVLRDRAVGFIRRADPARPFFLYLSPFAPHAPAVCADRHERLFEDQKAPRLPSFNEEDVSDKPAWLRELPRMTDAVIADSDAWYRRRLQALQAVDEMIGAVLDELQAKGQLDNTYLVFTSDNGFHLGEHRLDHGKGDPYEESIRVPFFVRGPGVPAGRTLDHMVQSVDLVPTLAALAGAPASENLDGRSLVPLLGPRPTPMADWRRDALIEHWVPLPRRSSGEADNEGDGGIPEYVALRTSDHLYVEYAPGGEREMYDLKKDPYQLGNFYSTAPAELIERLASRLAVLKHCRGPSCR